MRSIVSHQPQTLNVLAVGFFATALLGATLTDWPSPGNAPTDTDLTTVALVVLLLVALAGFLAHFRSPRAWARLGDIQAQGLFQMVARRLAPPAAAAALAAGHTAQFGDSTVVFASMVLAGVAFGGTGYPLHLTGLARLVFDLSTPVVGVALALLLATALGVSLDVDGLATPLLGAWFVAFCGGWLEEAFNAARPIRMAVIGSPGLASALALEMEGTNVHDHLVVGWVSDRRHQVTPEEQPGQPPLEPGLAWLGPIDQIRSVVAEQEIDLLVMAPRSSSGDLFKETVEQCVDLPVHLVQAARLYEEMHGRVPIGAISEAWFAYIMHPRFSPQAAWSKRLLDVAAATVLLVLVLPLMLIVATAVKLGDGGPVFFRQRRVGEHGREFHVLKFRTMRPDAECAGEARWAQDADPRATRVGQVLRKSHLDEMPQLLNVLAGSMSLVGPRPERPEFVTELEIKIPFYSRRMLVKPGITGWAQVRSGYSSGEVGTAFKLCHDLYYIKHRSMLFDLLTLVETARTLVADVQYGRFTFSEAFILGDCDLSREAIALGGNAVLGDTAKLAEIAGDPAMP